jgi:hypothetical protein
LATNVALTATALAPTEPSAPRSRRNSARETTVLTAPMSPNVTRRRPESSSSGRRAAVPKSTTPSPRANVRAIRAVPRRSPSALPTMFTRLSGSSIQSTGTSWIRSPLRSAKSSISVSKNHPSSRIAGTSRCAMSRRTALKPHCASCTRVASTVRRIRLYERDTNSRFGARATDDAGSRRDPIATSEWPDTKGATSGSSASRSVERSTSV